MTQQLHDISPLVDMTRRQMTGPVRNSRPAYVDLLPPCNNACPAGEDIQGWLALAQAGKFEQAWQHLIRDNPMPSIHGRVCYHPCESSCNRGELDTSVSIHAIERFLGDQARAQGWTMPKPAKPSGKRVLIVGAGPSGLSAGYHLTRLGHQVEIHEAGALAGGMLHFGIPAYRLPRDIVMEEVARIEGMGVKIILNHKVDDLLAEWKAGQFDAAFLAIGTQSARHIEIPARDAAHVLTAVSLLHDIGADAAPKLGRRVIVYGAGDTAMDAARSAKRLGASDAMIVFFSDRAHMEAHSFEANEALGEGVKIKWLSSIREIDGTAVKVEIMALDAKGIPQGTGKFETLEADSIILALGQQAESHFLRNIPNISLTKDGAVSVGTDLMTGYPGLFAGGDLVAGSHTVTSATGHGKKAAKRIDDWLHGRAHVPAAKHPIIHFPDLHLPIYSDAFRSTEAEVAPDARVGFGEVTAGLNATKAKHEAKRCLSCGNCYECDICFAACPEDAIAKLGPGDGFKIDLALCTGCAVCFEQCPCHAIDMMPEPIHTGTRVTA
jgi:NADPH-dependent glutamate synthase beta subunit-like oxidoreductase